MPIRKKAAKSIRLIVLSVLVIAIGYVVYSDFLNPKASEGAEIGDVAPDFTLKNAKGIELTLSDKRDNGIVLNFWATYCEPCEREMPHFEKALQKYKDQGIDIWAVNVAEPTRIVNQYIKAKDLTLPILLSRDGAVADQYQVINLPVTFFINSDGEIVEKVSGELTEEKLHDAIQLIKVD